MEFTFVKSGSTIKPEEIETKSSATTVYIRKNIVETTRTDMDGTETPYYEYDEAKVPKSEYQDYVNEKNRADIDFIALMSDISLYN